MIYKNFLDSNELCATLQREIVPLIKDSDFEEMYKGGGRPPISPRVLLLTTIMQYLERLSDREAAMNLKYRLDWKIAFGLPVDFKGAHHTTFVYFRDRLIESEKSSYAFDKVIEHLVVMGLVKKKQKQRIDSTHIIGNVRELSRLELLHETLRLFCRDIEEYKSEMDAKLLGYHELYSDHISIRGISDAQKKDFIKDAGISMRGFIEWGRRIKISSFESYQTLITVYEQNFKDENPDPDIAPELIKIATGKDHICSPHETDARYSTKGTKGWLGYKAQVAETITDNKEDVNFITHIDLNDATDFDGDAVFEMIEDVSSKGIEPSKLYGDTHYNHADNIENLSKEGIDLRGPVQPLAQKRTDKNKGFEVRAEEKKVICPQGVESKRFSHDRKELISASFPKDKCQSCQRKDICKPEPRGKIFTARPQNKILQNRREEMNTQAFKEEMHQRNGIEGTISGLVRGQGLRRSRFKSKMKTRFQVKFIGAAANIKRLHRRREMEIISPINGLELLMAA